jgi:predicted NBD/HSP70 family sugar kinase
MTCLIDVPALQETFVAVKHLVIDIGGTSVKVWSGPSADVRFSSGKKLTPQRFVDQLRAVVTDWSFDRVSIGYPGHVARGRPTAEPHNLASGWVEFDWTNAFPCPLRMLNDACMQGLGSYEGGRMLYLGFGTGLGTALIFDGTVVPLQLGHLPFRRRESFDSVLGKRGLERRGLKRWRRLALEAGLNLKDAFLADYVVLGGGNAKRLKRLPEGFRRRGNHTAYLGGVRMWDDQTFRPAGATL